MLVRAVVKTRRLWAVDIESIVHLHRHTYEVTKAEQKKCSMGDDVDEMNTKGAANV